MVYKSPVVGSDVVVTMVQLVVLMLEGIDCFVVEYFYVVVKVHQTTNWLYLVEFFVGYCD